MRYRFGDFVLSPARRVLASGGQVVPLIPRYFDLLVFLVEQRDRAVAKQEIFERVWADVVVSDSALTQAIRSIRVALGDDPREPRFVRTVSRRGYQFVFAAVELEDDSGPWPFEDDGRSVAAPTAAAGEAPAGELARDRSALVSVAARGASAGAATALFGACAGLAAGVALRFVPGSETGGHVALTLALVGALAGLLGGAGVGLGVSGGDAFGRWPRAASLGLGGALAGLITGWLANQGARAVLTGLFGRDVPAMGGPIEGLVLGAATGVGYALAAGRRGVVVLTGVATALGGMALALAGRHLVGASLDLMAGTFSGSQVGLEPLARLLGEEGLRPMTRLVVSAFEGLLFGSGVAFGLTLRPPRGSAGGG